MKKKLLEEIEKFKKLSGVKIINEATGESELADLLISKLVKTGEKNLPKEIASYTTENGVKGVYKVDYVKALLTKGELSVEERRILQSINKNIVEKVGSDVFTTAIKEATQGLDNLTALALEEKILKDYFDNNTRVIIEKRLNPSSTSDVNNGNDIMSNLENALKTRQGTVDYVIGEVKRVTGKKISKLESEQFITTLETKLNDILKKYDIKGNVKLSNLEEQLKLIKDEKLKNQIISETLIDFKNNLIKLSNDDKLPKSFRIKFKEYISSGAGFTTVVKDIKNDVRNGISFGAAMKNHYLPTVKWALLAASIGTIGELISGENPFNDQGSFTNWVKFKYIVTLVPGINVLWYSGFALYNWAKVAVNYIKDNYITPKPKLKKGESGIFSSPDLKIDNSQEDPAGIR